jgi:hypothetical protein
MANIKKIIFAAVAATAVAAGGSAFTAGIGGTDPTRSAAYAHTTFTGATADDVVYNYSTDGKTVVSVVVTFRGDLTPAGVIVQYSFAADGQALTTLAHGVALVNTAGADPGDYDTTEATFVGAGLTTALLNDFRVFVTGDEIATTIT